MELNGYSVAFFITNAILIFKLPRKWALLPILVSACYMTRAQGIIIGPLHFSIIRLMLLLGFLRALIREKRLMISLNVLDRLVLVWAIWILISSIFHNDFSGALVYRLGLFYDVCGIYFLVRIFCQSKQEVVQLFKIIAIILVPVAAEMLYEKIAEHNIFSIFGGVDEIPYIRLGKARASGPFSHAILAGTVGAICFPITVSLWKIDRKISFIGSLASLIMIYASTSSGPILSALAGISALIMWRVRQKTKIILWFIIIGYISLDIFMNDPAYYIMARIDITGGSTGWHRAKLIQSSIEHISEWWIGGTDYTRHWMHIGLATNPNHADITNHYIQMGVWGGLPLMILFISQLIQGFSYVAKTLKRWSEMHIPVRYQFAMWALGASLFAASVTGLSISYFDQSYIFLYIPLAAISSMKPANLQGFYERQKVISIHYNL